MYKEEMPMWQMSTSDLKNIFKECLFDSDIIIQKSNTEKKYVYGISGIQSLLNCSESSAKRLKKSGAIDEAIIQNGRKIIIDVEKALELLKNNSKPGLKKR